MRKGELDSRSQGFSLLTFSLLATMLLISSGDARGSAEEPSSCPIEPDWPPPGSLVAELDALTGASGQLCIDLVEDTEDDLEFVEETIVVTGTLESTLPERSELSYDDVWIIGGDDEPLSFSELLLFPSGPPSGCSICYSAELFPSESVPRGYPVYATFLWPSYDSSLNRRRVSAIRRSFRRFGVSIGSKGAAVWFQRPKVSVDIGRAKSFCDKLDLSYDRGPYIIVSDRHPDDLDNLNGVILVRLTDLSPQRIVRVLNILEQDLRQGVEVGHEELLFEEIKQRVLSIGERNGSLLKEIFLAVVN